MKKILLFAVILGLLTGPAFSANTLNPTVPRTSDRGLDITFDGSTAFDLGFARTVVYAEYIPATAGNSISIRDGSATAPRVAVGKSVSGDPSIVYIYGATRVYVVGNQVSSGDILLLRFK